MPTEPKLEQYLSNLDKALGQIPVSDRSDIITEIKSHILEAQARDPNQELKQILSALGEPENVANRYLLERGIKTGRPSKSPMMKWLTIGFLGTFGIFALTFIILISKFTPLLKVDEEAGRVIILGGLIDVNDREGKIKIGDSNFLNNGRSKTIDGDTAIEPSKYDSIRIPFTNGKISLSPSSDQHLRWHCKVMMSQESISVNSDKRVFTLNLENTKGSKCDIQLPAGIATKIEGANGKLEVSHPQGNIEMKLGNGKIEINPDPNRQYRYETKVVNGTIKGLESSVAKNAILIQASVMNGSIERE